MISLVEPYMNVNDVVKPKFNSNMNFFKIEHYALEYKYPKIQIKSLGFAVVNADHIMFITGFKYKDESYYYDILKQYVSIKFVNGCSDIIVKKKDIEFISEHQ